MTTVSIIIVNYNAKGMLADCIRSIHGLTRDIDYEIIVADNNSKDGSKEQFGHRDDIRYYYNETNLGFGQANNQAVAFARGEFLLFLNPDTLLKTNIVKQLHDFYIAHEQENIGALGCYIYDERGNLGHSHARFKRLTRTMKGRYRRLLKKALFLDHIPRRPRHSKAMQPSTKPIEVDYVTGADLFVAKHVFIDMHGFDQDFFMYFEETELQYRMAKNGLRRFIVPNTYLVHHQGATFSGSTSNHKRKIKDCSELTYVKKIRGILAFYVYKAFFLLAIALDTIVDIYRREHSLSENLSYVVALARVK